VKNSVTITQNTPKLASRLTWKKTKRSTDIQNAAATDYIFTAIIVAMNSRRSDSVFEISRRSAGALLKRPFKSPHVFKSCGVSYFRYAVILGPYQIDGSGNPYLSQPVLEANADLSMKEGGEILFFQACYARSFF
jgi:hypothetical protein